MEVEKSVATMKIVNGERDQPLIEISKGKCNVKTLRLSMSQGLRIKIFTDLLSIGLIPAIAVYCALRIATEEGFIVCIGLGIVAMVCAVCNTICDFNNWVYTMNIYLDRMGQWYAEDIVNIFHSLVDDVQEPKERGVDNPDESTAGS